MAPHIETTHSVYTSANTIPMRDRTRTFEELRDDLRPMLRIMSFYFLAPTQRNPPALNSGGVFGFPAHFARTLAIEHTCPMRVRACTHRPALQRAERIERCSTWRCPASSANDGARIRLLGILAERIRFRT
jgi:hypothetical protein